LNSQIDQVPISIVQGLGESVGFDLMVSEVRFSELLKRWAKVKLRGEKVLDLNAPITDGDHSCDFSGVGGVN
jgi:hypothetical protein